MAKMIHISDGLASDALHVAQQSQRTVEDQVELWAQLGKVIAPLLGDDKAGDLVRQVKQKSVSELIASVDTPEGKLRTREYLASLPFPHFEAATDVPGYLVRIEADGTRTVGRFVDRVFIAKCG